MLTSADSNRIAKIVLSRISRHSLRLPLQNEREPGFTARVLMPLVDQAVREIDISGLTLHGDGRASAPATVLPSCEFRPDIALLYWRKRVVALEVKFLRLSGRQSSLSAAIGQAVVYRATGYEIVGVILIDLAPVSGEAAAIQSMLRELNILACVFSRSGSKIISAAL